MRKTMLTAMGAITALMIIMVASPSFAIESTVVMKTTKESPGVDRPGNAPGMDNPGDRGPGRGGFRRELKRFFRHELGLTDEQRAKMRQMRKESRERVRADRDAVRKIREEKLNILLSGNVDTGKLAKLDEQYMKHHTQLDLERLKMKRERAALLTPDQARRLGEFLKNKMDEIKARRSARMGRDRGFDDK